MNSLSFVVLAAAVAFASAGLLHAPVVGLAGPAVYPSHVVGPLALPHPISYASPAYTKFSPVVAAAPVVYHAAPVVKTVYAAPVVKTVVPVAPVYKTFHAAPVYAAPAW